MPDGTTYKLVISDSESKLLTNFVNSLLNKNPSVKTLFSIGGGGSNSTIFSTMASEVNTRKLFIDSTIETARKFGFDGLDLDWEFPQSPKEMDHLGLLFSQWRAAIDKEAKSTGRPPLLLTAAVYFSVEFLVYGNYRKYPTESIAKNLDWASPMCFDFAGSWDKTATGAHAALYNPNSKSTVSTSYGLKSWIRAGVPGEKLVMGLPLYGKSWTLKDPNLHRVGSPAVDVGPGDEGVMTLTEVEKFNKENKATVVFDSKTVSTYSYVGSIWVGYDDVVSTTVKIGFAKAHGLRGYFFWAISLENNWRVASQGNVFKSRF